MIKKIFVFAPNKIDSYTVGANGVVKIETSGSTVFIMYESSVKVYEGMSYMYDAERGGVK